MSHNLPDVQSRSDERGKHIQKVGINNYAIPFQVKTRDHGMQSTCGTVSMYTSLNEDTKGVNMSRYSQVIEKAIQKDVISIDFLDEVLQVLRDRLGSTDSYVKVKFPYFIKKQAPVSGNISHFKVDCELEGRCTEAQGIQKYLTVTVQYTSLCPCSKEMSLVAGNTSAGQGAHNQRSSCKLTVHLLDFIWVEELVELIESCVSCPIWNTLKRPDEKYVTEHAYQTPGFVEDVAREVSLRMDQLVEKKSTDSYVAVITHEESIHQSNAIAVIKGGKCDLP